MTAILSELADLAELLRVQLIRALLRPEPEPEVGVVPAGPPFAASSYARARLLHQLHATGLADPPEAVRPASPR
jgi:hypothetical protein